VSESCPTLRRDGDQVVILDQTRLPHEEHYVHLHDLDSAATAIRDMQVRGAPLIGATAAFGVALALHHAADDDALHLALDVLRATRPTAVNLHWALDRMRAALAPLPPSARSAAAWAEAEAIQRDDAAANGRIGNHGLAALRPLATTGRPLQLMTHCNAGWLATCGHGTALAPIYAAHDAGMDIHVWVSETRPRNQGLLTAWELARAGIPHTLIADNAAGWLMAAGRVDAVIVGTDRIAANGHRQQGGHLPQGPCGPRPRSALLCGRPPLDHRLRLPGRPRHPHRGACWRRIPADPRDRWPGPPAVHPDRRCRRCNMQSGLRCDAGGTGHWHNL